MLTFEEHVKKFNLDEEEQALLKDVINRVQEVQE